jgi:hypothetical protein
VKKHYLHRVLAFLYAAIVFLPISIQAVHAFENHEHTICTAKDIKHIHELDAECGLNHAQINTGAFDFPKSFVALSVNPPTPVFIPYLQIHSSPKLYSKSSRAPPVIIV